MPIYTKKGDRGETGLPGGRRLPKTDAVFEVLGSLDELNAALGLADSYCQNKEIQSIIQQLQSDLLSLGASVASDSQTKRQFEPITSVKIMENRVDEWEKATGPLQNFILPGGCKEAAAVHVCRTLARKAERRYHRLGQVEPDVAIFLNRLSDYLFQLSRYLNHLAAVIEPIWRAQDRSK